MAFGAGQLNNPTPSSINNLSGAITAILTGVITWLQTVDFIPSHTVKVVTGLCGLGVLLMNALRPFFGQAITTQQVPAEAVTSVDTSKLK